MIDDSAECASGAFRAEEDVEALLEAIRNVRENVHFCKICGNFTEHEICDICAARKPTTICVVKEPKDITALEKVKGYDGVYHVLGGVISPIDRVGPDDIRIKELLARLDGVSDTRHQPRCGRGGDRNVHRAAHKTARHKGDEDSSRASRGQRHRVRGRGHALARVVEPNRALTPIEAHGTVRLFDA